VRADVASNPARLAAVRSLGPIGSLTLCVCTYNRPKLFLDCIDSIGRLAIPQGFSFRLVVADNNPESHYELYIGARLRSLPFPWSYAHEPSPGYSNARNKALELALDGPAEILAFVDDDTTVDSDWLSGHLRSYEAFACDVVEGATRRGTARESISRSFVHGAARPTARTANVSFKRWLVDPDGAGLRFDPRFNQTGHEDQAFFSAAHRAGAEIVFSGLPIVSDWFGEHWPQDVELMNKAFVAAIAYRNKVTRLRKERSFAAGLAAALWGVWFGLKSVPAYLDYRASRAFNAPHRADRKRANAYKNFHKMIQGFRGLRGDYVARQTIRRSF
jgi:succinoglycan biosynthesis protein ExoM